MNHDPLVKLNELSKYGEDWDSYGAPPPDPLAIDRARLLLLRLYNVFALKGELCPIPFLSLIPGGNVQFDLTTSSSRVEFICSDSIAIEYLLVHRDAEREKHFAEGIVITDEELYELIRRMRLLNKESFVERKD